VTTETRSVALVLEEPGLFPAPRRRVVGGLGRDETLVRIGAAQVGHLDMDVVEGRFPGAAPPPLVPGTEGAGRVVASARWAEGARVRFRGGGVGIRRDGAWAEHVIVPDDALVAVPDGVPDALACCFFSPAGTAWAAVRDVVRVQQGDRVLVTGAAGAVGGLAVQLALEAGATVTGTVGRAGKLPHVPLGAEAVLASELAGEGEPASYDAVIDTVGGDLLAAMLRLLRPGGRAALVGYSAGRRLELDIQQFLLADVPLLPVNLLSRGPHLRQVADELLGRLAGGELYLPVETSGAADLSDAAARLRRGEVVGKLALVWGA